MSRSVVAIRVFIASIAAAVAVTTPVALAHPNGAWLTAQQVDRKMRALGFTRMVNCAGRGAYRYPPNVAPNQGLFFYRHFRCMYEVTWNHWRVACVHTQPNGSITGRTFALPHTCRW